MACVREYRGKWIADWRDETGRRFIKPFSDCSTLLMAGRPDTEVAKLAGHRDSSVTRRIYAHWLNPDHDPAALDSLDGIATDALAALGEAAPAAAETDGNTRRQVARLTS